MPYVILVERPAQHVIMALLATQRNHLPAARASRVAKSAPLSGHSAHVPVRQARRATVARVANVTDDTFSAEVLKASSQ